MPLALSRVTKFFTHFIFTQDLTKSCIFFSCCLKFYIYKWVLGPPIRKKNRGEGSFLFYQALQEKCQNVKKNENWNFDEKFKFKI